MTDETINALPVPSGIPETKEPLAREQPGCDIPACCEATIFEHVRINPKMVCSTCKNIIKCFPEERAFQNYLTFCRSRRRTVLTGLVQHYWTIAFRSYDTFNR